MSAKREVPWHSVYSVRLTEAQRVALARLGGGDWLREQIERAIKDATAQNKQ